MKFLKIIYFIILITVSSETFSQENEVKLIENLILKKTYFEADSLLKQIILNQESVSSEITFLFGKNSYFLKKYEQSINWLNKYLELKGEKGKYSDESIKFLELSNAKNIIDNFNKKALYIMIREMTDVKTSKITQISNVFRKIYPKIQEEVLTRGHIDNLRYTGSLV